MLSFLLLAFLLTIEMINLAIEINVATPYIIEPNVNKTKNSILSNYK